MAKPQWKCVQVTLFFHRGLQVVLKKESSSFSSLSSSGVWKFNKLQLFRVTFSIPHLYLKVTGRKAGTLSLAQEVGIAMGFHKTCMYIMLKLSELVSYFVFRGIVFPVPYYSHYARICIILDASLTFESCIPVDQFAWWTTQIHRLLTGLFWGRRTMSSAFFQLIYHISWAFCASTPIMTC